MFSGCLTPLLILFLLPFCILRTRWEAAQGQPALTRVVKKDCRVSVHFVCLSLTALYRKGENGRDEDWGTVSIIY